MASVWGSPACPTAWEIRIDRSERRSAATVVAALVLAIGRRASPVHVFDPADLAADIEYLLGEHGGGSLVLIQAGADVAVAVRECDTTGVLLERPSGARRLSSSAWSFEELAPSLAVLASALGVAHVVVSGVHAPLIQGAVRGAHVHVSVSVLDDSVANAAALAVALHPGWLWSSHTRSGEGVTRTQALRSGDTQRAQDV